MAQNENISLSLANKIDVLNKTQSVDARYGVYDTEEDALDVMTDYGLDGRQVAVYTDKANGKVKLYLYNQVKHQLEPIDDQALALTLEQARTNNNTVEGVILGSEEFDKGGNRKAFAQIADLEDAGFITEDDVTNISLFTQYTESTVSGTDGSNLIQPDLGLPILEVDDLQENSSYSGELVLNIENNNIATAKVIRLFGVEIYNNTNPSADITAKINFTLDFFNQVGDNIDYKLSWEYLSSGEILFGEYLGTIDNTSDVDFGLIVTGHSKDNFNLKKARLWRN